MTDFLCNNDELMNEIGAANYLKLKNHKTMAVWRSTKKVNIPYVKIGRNVRYRKSDLDKHLINALVR